MQVFSFQRNNLRVTRKVSAWQPGLLRVRQRFHAEGHHQSTLCTGKQWIYATGTIKQGQVGFQTSQGYQPAPERFTMYLPPFALIRILFDGAVLLTDGFLSRAPIMSTMSLPPLMTETFSKDLPQSVPDLVKILLRSNPHISIDPEQRQTMAKAAKGLIDAADAAGQDLSITQLSTQLMYARESVSRAFRRTYDLSPIQYSRRIRIMNAIMKLAQGEAILRTAFEVGFQDLSRFYHQFKDIAAATPKSYTSIMVTKRQDSGVPHP